MKHVTQSGFQPLDPKETAELSGGFHPVSVITFLAEAIASLGDCTCACNNPTYHP